MRNIILMISFLLTSCANSPDKNAALSSPVLGTLERGGADFVEKKISSKSYKYNLLYLDTRSPDFNKDQIYHAYSLATGFGKNTKNSLVLVASINSIKEFHKISKHYHDLYVGERYSYNDAPFLVAVKNSKMDFVVSLGGLSNICISRFFLDLEQAVNLEILDRRININIPAEAAFCEVTKIQTQSDIVNIINFMRNFIKGKF